MPQQDGAPSSEAPSTTSLELGFELTHDLVRVQLDQNDALDTKANFILGSATVLLGTYVALLAARTANPTFSLSDHLVMGAPLALVYIVTVLFAYQAYDLRDYTVVPNPTTYVDLFVHLEERETRLILLKTLAAAYEVNAAQLSRKAVLVGVALTFLYLEAVVLIATIGASAFL
jgi:hypothetical protein